PINTEPLYGDLSEHRRHPLFSFHPTPICFVPSDLAFRFSFENYYKVQGGKTRTTLTMNKDLVRSIFDPKPAIDQLDLADKLLRFLKEWNERNFNPRNTVNAIN